MFNKHSRHIRWIAGWLALMFAMQGCSAPPAPPPTGIAVQAPQASATAVEFEGISFSFDSSIGGAAPARNVPSDPVVSGMEMWLVAAHTEFTFPDYPVVRPLWPARILIFPVSAWHSYNPEAEKQIAALQKLLAGKPAAFGQGESIPVLPTIRAGQIIRAQVSYLSFQDGSGVRFITQYNQNPTPINNSEMFYTFQGLTSDGHYYVSVFFPVMHRSLPDDASHPSAAVGSDFEGYLSQMTGALDAEPPGSFSPQMGTLDTIVQSLKVK